jgi:hypothetical protein
MSTLSESVRTKAARDALEEALVRLRLGKPRNPLLAAVAAQGKLKVTVTTVAKEAGVSRTSIGVENCRFPDIRTRILLGDAGNEPRPVKGLTAEVQRLRVANAELRRQVETLQSQQAVMLERVLNAERKSQLAEDDLKRARQIPGGEPGTGEVVLMSVYPKPNGRRRR